MLVAYKLRTLISIFNCDIMFISYLNCRISRMIKLCFFMLSWDDFYVQTEVQNLVTS